MASAAKTTDDEVRITQDESAVGGFAFVDLGRKITREPLRLAVRCLEPETRYLGPGGWQPQIHRFAPLQIDQRGPTTIVRVGPEIVDQIPELLLTEIAVEREPPLPVLRWPPLRPSPPKPPIKVAAPPEIVGPGSASKVESPLPDPARAPLPPVVPPPPPPPPPDPDGETGRVPGRRWRGPVALLAVLLLVLAGGAAWFSLYPLQDRQPPDPPPPVPAPEPPPLPPSPPEEFDRRIADLITRGAPASEFEELGRQALRHGYGKQAFRAFDEPDPKQNPETALQLARFYDPRLMDPVHRDVTRPNLGWAIRYYQMHASGSDRHKQELAALCTRFATDVQADAALRQLCR